MLGVLGVCSVGVDGGREKKLGGRLGREPKGDVGESDAQVLLQTMGAFS